MGLGFDKVIELYRRRGLLMEANKAFAALRRNPRAWKAEMEERAAWDIISGDDLKVVGRNTARNAVFRSRRRK